jgi:rare lipoprotein A (peptidoglycan hydrolase)
MNDLTARIAAEQEEQIRREAVATSRRRAAEAREAGEAHRLVDRPDRVALWAFLMALAITIAAAASSQASSGGIGATSPEDGGGTEMDRALATWYGPGLWGNETACGQTLRRKTVGVAHRKLPCGTEVTIAYKGETLTTEVIDRGPFGNDATWDLTKAAAEKIGFTETDQIRTSVDRRK